MLALDLGYLLLLLVYQSLTVYNVVASTLLIGLSYVSYQGILEDHAKPNRENPDALAGGASLDLLGLVVIVQYGTVIVSEKFYWALLVIPLWGGWKMYSIFGSSGSALMPKNQVEGTEDSVDRLASEKADAKRQRRSERRRQKWA